MVFISLGENLSHRHKAFLNRQHWFAISAIFLMLSTSIYAQEVKIGDDYLSRFSKQLDRETIDLRKASEKLLRKLCRKDSAASIKFGRLFKRGKVLADSTSRYLLEYHSVADSLVTGLDFLSTKSGKLTGVSSETLLLTKEKLGALQSEINQASQIRVYLSQRGQQLKDMLSPRAYREFQKEAYYYSQKVQEFRNHFNDPDALQAQLLGVLRELPAFRSFFLANSYLSLTNPTASLGVEGNSIAGLQGRSDVLGQVDGILGNTAGASLSANPFNGIPEQASSELERIRADIKKYGSTSSDELLPPGFKPNRQRLRSFLRRFEYGCSIQSQPNSSLFPSMTELAFTAGFRIDDNNSFGLGASYKQGWGKPFSKISLSCEGFGLRSYIEGKIKKSLYLTGGYELNYLSGLKQLSNLRGLDIWQPSGLVGVSKKCGQGKRSLKLQLLWDFLSYSQVPIAQPVKFRLAYNL